MDRLYSTGLQQPKRSRKSEIALLEKISSSLDTYIGDNPTSTTTPNKATLASDKSKNAASNFLLAKTLVKSIAKACAVERVTGSEELTVKTDAVGKKEEEEGDTDDDEHTLLDSLVDGYKPKFPSLSKKMLLNGMTRYNTQNDIQLTEGEQPDDIELVYGRIIAAVDVDMNAYHEKIETLKKSREIAASMPDESEEMTKKGRKRKSKGGDGDDGEPKSKRKPGRPKGDAKDADTSENFLINELVKRYAAARAEHDRLPNGVFEALFEETKLRCNMPDFNMEMKKLGKRVQFRYNKLMARDDTAREAVNNSQHKIVIQEIYVRYERTKIASGGKLPGGTLDNIIEGVKLEYGMASVDLKGSAKGLKTKVQSRFTREHPEFEEKMPARVKVNDLSEEDRKRRQLLMNEITVRYATERDQHDKKKLPDGSLDRIIQQTKNDLGIHDFEVHPPSIRGRINRKSLHVQSLGSESPYDMIDKPLVATINTWLAQGMSVTRQQGLDIANKLLKGKGGDKDVTGKEIVLDAKWWRNFLERNKKSLVCEND